MKLSQLIHFLQETQQLRFYLPNGRAIAPHFHVTEAGLTTKQFMDCGGSYRTEKYISFQLWVADDTDHRLSPEKLQGIIRMAAPLIGNEDLDVELEYQDQSIGRYGLAFDGTSFHLTAKQTRCLAEDQCGITPAKTKTKLSEIADPNRSCCSPGSGCCSVPTP